MQTSMPHAEKKLKFSILAEYAGLLIEPLPFTRSTQTEPGMHVYRVYLPSEILYHRKLKPGIAIMVIFVHFPPLKSVCLGKLFRLLAQVGIGTVGNKLLHLNDLSDHNKALSFNELSSNDIGKYFVSAELWASHQVPKGMVVLSNALMDAFENLEQNSNLRIALYEINGDIGICKHILLQIRLKEPNALRMERTKSYSLKNVGDTSKADSARNDNLKSQKRFLNRPEEQKRNPVAESTKIQNEVVEDLLKGMLRADFAAMNSHLTTRLRTICRRFYKRRKTVCSVGVCCDADS